MKLPPSILPTAVLTHFGSAKLSSIVRYSHKIQLPAATILPFSKSNQLVVWNLLGRPRKLRGLWLDVGCSLAVHLIVSRGLQLILHASCTLHLSHIDDEVM